MAVLYQMPIVEHLRFQRMQYYTPMSCHFQVLHDSNFQCQEWIPWKSAKCKICYMRLRLSYDWVMIP